MNRSVPNKKGNNQNPIEALTSIPGDAIGELTSLGKDTVREAIDWKKWLGFDEEQANFGELAEGQELSLEISEAHQEIKQEAAYDYTSELLNSERQIRGEKDNILQAQIREILAELKKLISSSAEMQVRFEQIVVEEEIPVDAGQYHLNFFESFLLFVRDLREKVENSNSWMGALHSKKGAKQYWNMAKKFGTTFSMSHERNVATQAG